MESTKRSASATGSGRTATARRACAACRTAKTKCVFAEGATICTLCRKSNLKCEPSGLRKPRASPASKFVALEAKVDQLMKALASEKGSQQREQALAQDSDDTPINDAIPLADDVPDLDIDGLAPASILDDVIPAIVTQEQAVSLLACWKTSIHPRLPFVTLPGYQSFEDAHKESPITLLAILTAASAVLIPSCSRLLASRSLETLTRLVHVEYQSSLDLVQALLIYHFYPVPHRTPGNIIMPHAHTAAVMAHDLGLDKVLSVPNNSGEASGQQSASSGTRLWLASIFATSSCVNRHKVFRSDLH
jgi:hypothetical protein